MLSNKHNLTLTYTTGLISFLFDVASFQDTSFANYNYFNAFIMILPKIIFACLHFNQK